jgi:hypothetical protein
VYQLQPARPSLCAILNLRNFARKNVKNFSNLFMMKVIEVFFHGKIECCLVLYDLCILRYKFMLYSVLKLYRSKSGAIKMLLLSRRNLIDKNRSSEIQSINRW